MKRAKRGKMAESHSRVCVREKGIRYFDIKRIKCTKWFGQPHHFHRNAQKQNTLFCRFVVR